MGFLFESHTWIVVLAGWSVLLLLGLAGGDPLAAGRPGSEALLFRFVKWLAQTWSRHGRTTPVTPVAPVTPVTRIHRTPTPARRTTESGLHPAV